jgi:hypothetical protein
VEAKQQRAKCCNQKDVDKVPREAVEPRSRAHGDKMAYHNQESPEAGEDVVFTAWGWCWVVVEEGSKLEAWKLRTRGLTSPSRS